jgi:PncC family amidohydrolase
MRMPVIELEIGNLLRDKHLTLGTVESATGGLISCLITAIPGSSDYYKGSIIAYSNEIKQKVVGVKVATLKKEGSVSSAVAEEMAAGGRKVLGVDICLSDTGRKAGRALLHRDVPRRRHGEPGARFRRQPGAEPASGR